MYMSEWECLGALSPLDCFSLFRNRWFLPNPLAYFPLGGFVFTLHYGKIAPRRAHPGRAFRTPLRHCFVGDGGALHCGTDFITTTTKWVAGLLIIDIKVWEHSVPFDQRSDDDMKAFCSGSWLVSWSCSRRKRTAPGLEWSRAGWCRLRCFVPHQGAIVVFTYVQLNGAKEETVHPLFILLTRFTASKLSPVFQDLYLITNLPPKSTEH